MPRLQTAYFSMLVKRLEPILTEYWQSNGAERKVKMPGEIVVLVSCPQTIAESIARTLVTEKIAACISVLPQVKSIYIWQGQMCNEEECLLFIKTIRANFKILEKRIKELHTYEIPEIIALSIETGHAPYLSWLNNALTKV